MLFQREIKGRKPINKKRRFYIKIFLIMLLIILMGYNCYIYINKRVIPILFAITEKKIQTKATLIINRAVKEVIQENNITADQLVTYHYNEKGELQSCGVNTIKINEFSAYVIDKITEDMERLRLDKIFIPLGNIINKSAFANFGPEISIDVIPVGSILINYDREFQSAGINQVNHRVWLNIKTNLQVVIPMITKEVSISQQVMLVDRVLNGGNPNSFVNVPEDNILDVAP